MGPSQSTWENCKNVVYVYVLICVFVSCEFAITCSGGILASVFYIGVSCSRACHSGRCNNYEICLSSHLNCIKAFVPVKQRFEGS